MSLRQAAQEFSNLGISRRVASRYAADLPKDSKPFFQASQRAEKSLKALSRLTKQLRNADQAKAQQLYGKVVDEAHKLIDEAIEVHKKLQPLKGPHADAEFKVMGASIHKLERKVAEGRDSSVPSFSADQIQKAAELLYGDIHRVSAFAVSGNL